MSISALTSEAARLLAYYQGAESSINAQVAAAVAAVPTLQKTYFVDAVAGNDSNTGLSNSPFQTIDQAISLALQAGGVTTLVLQDGQTHTISDRRVIEFGRVRILGQSFYSTGARHATPAEIGLADLGTVNGGRQTGGFSVRFGALGLYGVDIATPDLGITPADLTDSDSIGLLFRSDVFFSEITISHCEVTLNACPLIRSGLGFRHISANSTSIDKQADFGLYHSNGPTPFSLYAQGLTLTGTDTAGLITGDQPIIYDAGGRPMNVISNIDLSE